MNKRFQIKEKQLILGGTISIIVDTETWVHYLVGSNSLGANCVTPLLDSNGK